MILNITSTDRLYSDFLEIYKEDKSLEYFMSSSIFKNLLSNETILFGLKMALTRHATADDFHIDYYSFIKFDRHEILKEQLREIFAINENERVTLYGPTSSGKTTFAKLFTKDLIVFDIDETMEINVNYSNLDITWWISY
jgi:polynucleotide 5'-kinase involved in rRNA processing